MLLGDVAGLSSRQPQMRLAGLAKACQRSWDEVSYEFSLERMMYDELATTGNSTFHMRIAELFGSLNGECGVYIPGTTTSAYADAEHISNAGATYLVLVAIQDSLPLSSFKIVCWSKRAELLVYDLVRPSIMTCLGRESEKAGQPGRSALNDCFYRRYTRRRPHINKNIYLH